MKNFLKLARDIGLIAAMLTFAGAAQATDLKGNSPFVAQPASVSNPVNWTGFYISGHVGYGNANHELDVNVRGYEGESFNLLNLDGLNSSGAVFGVSGGFDIKPGSVLFGVLAGYSWDNMETSLSIFDGAARATLEKEDEWYVGARAGILPWNNTLLYIGAAYVETSYELKAGGFRRDFDYQGVKALAGIETNISGGLFTKIEYQHDFYGDVTLFSGDDARVTDTLDEDKILFGLTYKFGAPDRERLNF